MLVIRIFRPCQMDWLSLLRGKPKSQFGLKVAIIGIPGLPNSVAVADGGSASLGQRSNVALVDVPAFINTAKYLIPAVGLHGRM